MDANPGHWVMPEIFLQNGTFTMLEMTAFLLKTFFNSMHWCKSDPGLTNTCDSFDGPNVTSHKNYQMS